MTLTKDQIAELRRLDKSAPGEKWHQNRGMEIRADEGSRFGHMKICDIRGWGFLAGQGGLAMSPHDARAVQEAAADLICAMRNALPPLLDAAEEVGRLRDVLGAEIEKIESDERYHYKPANVMVNAPLALEQAGMAAAMAVLKRLRAALKGGE